MVQGPLEMGQSRGMEDGHFVMSLIKNSAAIIRIRPLRVSQQWTFGGQFRFAGLPGKAIRGSATVTRV
ncbi:hypothetical protein Q668_04535 [Alcanivorax sp. PN-3]|nr:hypothetical protein Q668_04535 [Alcanivorax sp. PN-3]PHS72280.1 MAG: hypothetical protein COB00_01410 [Alcanivorax sp.]